MKSSIQVGSILDGYKIIRFLGSGGFGEVWLCQSEVMGDYRALKMVPSTDSSRLEREFSALTHYRKAATRLSSPYLLSIEHVNQNQNGLYYVMPLADGLPIGDAVSPDSESWVALTLQSLMELKIKHGEWFTSEEIISTMTDVLKGLQLLSNHKLVHRDVKPENILFFNGTPCLADISLVGEDSAHLTRRGTPGYCTPSWYAGGLPDMYGAAALLYTLLTGNSPDKMGRAAFLWPAQGEASLTTAEQQQWKRLHHVIRRATQEEVAERFLDFTTMSNVLSSNEKLTIPAQTPTTNTTSAPRSHNPKLLVFILAVVSIMIAGGALWFLSHKTTSTQGHAAKVEHPKVETPTPLLSQVEDHDAIVERPKVDTPTIIEPRKKAANKINLPYTIDNPPILGNHSDHSNVITYPKKTKELKPSTLKNTLEETPRRLASAQPPYQPKTVEPLLDLKPQLASRPTDTTKSLTIKARKPYKHYASLAKTNLYEQNYADTIEYLDELLTAYPELKKQPGFCIARAYSLFKLGKRSKAKELLTSNVMTQASEANILLREYVLESSEGAKAIEKLAENFGYNIMLHYYQAKIQLAMRQYTEVHQSYLQALKLAPVSQKPIVTSMWANLELQRGYLEFREKLSGGDRSYRQLLNVSSKKQIEEGDAWVISNLPDIFKDLQLNNALSDNQLSDIASKGLSEMILQASNAIHEGEYSKVENQIDLFTGGIYGRENLSPIMVLYKTYIRRRVSWKGRYEVESDETTLRENFVMNDSLQFPEARVALLHAIGRNFAAIEYINSLLLKSTREKHQNSLLQRSLLYALRAKMSVIVGKQKAANSDYTESLNLLKQLPDSLEKKRMKAKLNTLWTDSR